MADFTISFFICNLWLCLPVLLLLAVKKCLKKQLSGRMPYHLWFLLLILLAVPFLPEHFTASAGFLRQLPSLPFLSFRNPDVLLPAASGAASGISENWLQDFTLSVSHQVAGRWHRWICLFWVTGMFIRIGLLTKARIHLNRLTQSALPLQNKNIRRLFKSCQTHSKIMRPVRLYSSAFLKSPFTIGFIRPKIYVPIHLISDFDAGEMRCIFLHELQHCRHLDGLVNHFINLFSILYWFNPLIRYAFREMKNDREIACDSSVLELLDPTEYKDYENTLIRFAEKVSQNVFPFVSGLAGHRKQLKKRILNIAAYHPASPAKKFRGRLIYLLTAVLFLQLFPVLSIHAAGNDRYTFHPDSVVYEDLVAFFNGFDGCFVLYDDADKNWHLYNGDAAVQRVSPDSTWKIYDALLALEAGIITPEASHMAWDGHQYPFDAWNRDQTLDTAMKNSVNWYFQTADRRLGPSAVKHFIKKIHYGNADVSDDFPSYWLESSLKISAVEQVELLEKFRTNRYGCTPENIRAVKDTLRISASGAGTLYGKTGTGQIDGENINGWFIGFIEKPDRTCYFAVNIRGTSGAAGSKAAEIARSVLSELHLL